MEKEQGNFPGQFPCYKDQRQKVWLVFVLRRHKGITQFSWAKSCMSDLEMCPPRRAGPQAVIPKGTATWPGLSPTSWEKNG